MRAVFLVLFIAAGCGEDGLSKLKDDAAPDLDGDPTLLDLGVRQDAAAKDAGVIPDATPQMDATAMDATAMDAAEPDGGAGPGDSGLGRKLSWLRAPSSGGTLRAPGGEHTLRVRLAPPTAHDRASGPAHEVGSVLSGRAHGGNR